MDADYKPLSKERLEEIMRRHEGGWGSVSAMYDAIDALILDVEYWRERVKLLPVAGDSDA